MQRLKERLARSHLTSGARPSDQKSTTTMTSGARPSDQKSSAAEIEQLKLQLAAATERDKEREREMQKIKTLNDRNLTELRELQEQVISLKEQLGPDGVKQLEPDGVKHRNGVNEENLEELQQHISAAGPDGVKHPNGVNEQNLDELQLHMLRLTNELDVAKSESSKALIRAEMDRLQKRYENMLYETIEGAVESHVAELKAAQNFDMNTSLNPKSLESESDVSQQSSYATDSSRLSAPIEQVGTSSRRDFRSPKTLSEGERTASARVSAEANSHKASCRERSQSPVSSSHRVSSPQSSRVAKGKHVPRTVFQQGRSMPKTASLGGPVGTIASRTSSPRSAQSPTRVSVGTLSPKRTASPRVSHGTLSPRTSSTVHSSRSTSPASTSIPAESLMSRGDLLKWRAKQRASGSNSPPSSPALLSPEVPVVQRGLPTSRSNSPVSAAEILVTSGAPYTSRYPRCRRYVSVNEGINGSASAVTSPPAPLISAGALPRYRLGTSRNNSPISSSPAALQSSGVPQA